MTGPFSVGFCLQSAPLPARIKMHQGVSSAVDLFFFFKTKKKIFPPTLARKNR